MPPAPGWFSTIDRVPSAFESAGCAARVIVSTPDAVATGRMNLIGAVAELRVRVPCASVAPTTQRQRQRKAHRRGAAAMQIDRDIRSS